MSIEPTWYEKKGFVPGTNVEALIKENGVSVWKPAVVVDATIVANDHAILVRLVDGDFRNSYSIFKESSCFLRLPFTQDSSVNWKQQGLCPQCGDKGQWISMACVCPMHGRFLG
jgi:hypothetical protein